MAFRQRRNHQDQSVQGQPPRGFYLAFLALAVQVMLPFLVAVQIARLSDPAFADTVICSALSASTHDSGTGSDHHGTGDVCPLCGSLALGHAFTASAAPPVPLPRHSVRIVLAAANSTARAFIHVALYQSRGPPAIV